MGEDLIPHIFEDCHEGLSTQEADIRLVKYGRNELPEKNTPGWLIFLMCLWGPMPIALWVAIITEFSLTNWPDAGILCGIQFGNATIGWYETTKAGDAVAALKKSLKPRATVFRDARWQEIDAATVVPGDKVKLASGSAIPADCSVNGAIDEGEEPQIDVDESALTGESLPVTMVPKEHTAKMGSTVVRGEVDGTVQYTGVQTVFGKTALLLQSVETDLGNIHYVLVKIMYGLTGLSFILCTICFIYLMVHLKKSFRDSIEFCVVLLIVSIPIAIEIVVTTTLALGSRELSAKKVIVTRLSAIEMMAAVNMLCSDKTGTLTLNKMEIQEYCPTFSDSDNLQSVLVLAALAAKWREPPRDALDTMVLTAANLPACDQYIQLEYKPFDPRVKRTEAMLKNRDDATDVFKVTKGAPNVVLELCANKDEIRGEVEKIITDLGGRGIRCLCIAKTNRAGEWMMAGILTFLDPPRPDTKQTIINSRRYGVGVKMITGDIELIAKEMARMLDLGTNIVGAKQLPQFPESGDPKDIPDTLGRDHGPYIEGLDGFAHVHPEHKYLIVEALRQRGWVVAMTGDGVNDAPALKRADVGIAVHPCTDAARAASDMVLTEAGLSVIVDAMLIARGVFQRMQSFLTYRVSATLQLVFFFFIAVFALPPYTYGVVGRDTEFFHLPVLMFMLITLLNDGTLMSIGYDNVVPDFRPKKWNLPCLFFIAAVLAGVACVSSLMLLWMELDAHLHRISWYSSMHLPRLHYDQIVTSIYLKISISDFLTLFAGRTGTKPFFAVAPGKVLLWGAIGSLTLSTLVATFWPASSPDHVNTRGLWYNPAEYAESSYKYKLMPLFVWGYCVTWWFIQDLVKVLVYIVIEHFDIFSFRSLADPDANRAADCSRVPAAGGENEKLLPGQQTPGDYASGGITHISGSGYGAAGNINSGQ